ncbi:hypothetical protein N7509_013966 [Penicillium cosmopolitanum]|uniref:Uncharacterized protein n=1 Tax=Penicillium cosmopolitanum TaxID=1131564 RepID=A0A9W9VF08_9EURO|nr:uncharacterized protein N7509_013966 [Penicillium cosmopolitanum]KAJ5377080.1 hypothetical protein N7509_013966 [Penicillium cosmopolitanum]
MDYPTRRSSRLHARQVFARANFPLRAYGPRRGMALLKIGLFGTVGYFVAKKLFKFSSQQEYFDGSGSGDGSNGYKMLGWASTYSRFYEANWDC